MVIFHSNCRRAVEALITESGQVAAKDRERCLAKAFHMQNGPDLSLRTITQPELLHCTITGLAGSGLWVALDLVERVERGLIYLLALWVTLQCADIPRRYREPTFDPLFGTMRMG